VTDLLGRAAAALAPQARMIEVAGAGHAPFLTHADAVAAALVDFAATLPAA
jgi:pimeloyl-[acyl-carrier protein] methyl ester esterase